MTTIDADRWRDVFRPLDELLGRIQGLRFHLPDEEAAEDRVQAFAHRLATHLEDADRLLGGIRENYERQEDFGFLEDDDSLLDIGKMISAEVASQEVLDVLFLARAELKGARQELLTSLRGDWLRLASAADAALRALKKSLIAAESSLYEFEGVEPPERVWEDLDVSLAVRRLYGRLRRELLEGGDPLGDEIPRRLELAAEAFRGLRNSEIYPLLRFDDRQTFGRLRLRIEDWLHGNQRVEEGLGIWQDLSGFLELLKEVNFRQELREHDRSLLRKAYRHLFGPPSTPPPPTSVREDLSPLLGLDPDLDEILLSHSPPDRDAWKTTLARLLRDSSGVPPQDSSSI